MVSEEKQNSPSKGVCHLPRVPEGDLLHLERSGQRKKEQKKGQIMTEEKQLLPCPRAGFTLIEIAIVLVVLGLLLGAGVGLIGSLVKQAKRSETRTRLKEDAESLLGYALQNAGRLPKSANCSDQLRAPVDAWGKRIVCLTAPALSNCSACALGSGARGLLRVEDRENGVSFDNVAFILISAGANLNLQTATDPNSPITVHAQGEPVDDYPGDGTVARDYDDQVHYVILTELQAVLRCASSQERLRILNDELPPAYTGTPYSASVYVAGGVPPREWCVELRNPSPPQASTNFRITCGTQSVLTTGNCSASGAPWHSCDRLDLSFSSPPTVRGTMELRFHVRDTNAQEVSKFLVLTVR